MSAPEARPPVVERDVAALDSILAEEVVFHSPVVHTPQAGKPLTRLDDIEIEGIDMISWDGANRITEFKVMVRPLKAINLLHRLLAEQLPGAPPG